MAEEPGPAAVILLTEKPKEYVDAENKISVIKAEYMTLKVNGPDDKEGLAKIHPAWSHSRETRLGIEKTRVALKAPALEFERKVDAFAKELTAQILPVETYLKGILDSVEAEKKRAKLEADNKLFESRKQQWIEAGGEPVDRAFLLSHREDVFGSVLQTVRKQAEEKKRLAAEQAEHEERQREIRQANFLESKRLADERRELERKQEELRQQQAAIDKQKRDQEEAERIEAAKVQATKDEADRQERLRLQAIEEAKAKEAEAKRKEALRPIADKLNDFANKIWMLEPPDLPSAILDTVVNHLGRCADSIRGIAKDL